MDQDNRIIHRIGARELTEEERNSVSGAIKTFTICTITTEKATGGDEGPTSLEHC